jgi:glucose-1-phosphate cytidylyltransferase|tara:strand:- start:738 stop:1508 length:771 start_codon:yes stop_codon:yes gene_type:complete
MKVVILAGGKGTRITEESQYKPKPMIMIGNKPIVWHIMKIYSQYNFNEFVIALGYKGQMIKDYFINYQFINSDLRINLSNKEIKILNSNNENWIINLIETGEEVMTGGRIKKAFEFVNNETIMATYGDGLADIDINNLLQFHKSHGKLATITVVHPPSRFGEVVFDDLKVTSFKEKPLKGREGWVGGGFFVLDPQVADYIESYDTPFETSPLEKLCQDGELMAYKHEGFWHPVDVLRDKLLLQSLWDQNKAFWKTW